VEHCVIPPPEGFAMTIHGASRPPDWKDLYQLAILETDPAKLPLLITKANDAILDQIEQSDAVSLEGELALLNDALHALRLLRREYERCLKEFGEQRNERKVG